MRRKKLTAPAWTDHDSALWHTCEIVADLTTGTAPTPRWEIVTPFPPQLASGEQFLTSGAVTLLEQRAVGDGTYTHDGGFFFATGPLGLTMTAASAAARAAGNARRRHEAAQAAVPRWVEAYRGGLFVSLYGIHLQTTHAVSAWNWASVTAAQMVGPGAMHMLGSSTSGPVSWILRSDWAELVFVLWAVARHRNHPQLVAGGWLPPGWLQRCVEHQYSTRLASPAVLI